MKRALLYVILLVGLPFASVAQSAEEGNAALNDQFAAPQIEVGVQPNPASSILTIHVDGIENAQVRVIDVLGNVILDKRVASSETIDVSEFRNGIYFLNVSANGTRISRKFIVRH